MTFAGAITASTLVDDVRDADDAAVDANDADKNKDVMVADGLVAGPILIVDRSTSPHGSDPFFVAVPESLELVVSGAGSCRPVGSSNNASEIVLRHNER
jgi:hypothetical protein